MEMSINDKLTKEHISKFVMYRKIVKKGECNMIYSLVGLELNAGYIYKFKSFNNFDNKQTKIRKDYKKIKVDVKDIKKTWFDPSRKLLTKELIKKNDKLKIQHPNTKSYFTHDNSGRPFLVYIGKNEAHIYKKPDENTKYYVDEDEYYSSKDKKWCYVIKIKSYKFEEKFIGKSIENPMTRFSAGYGPEFTGNSILLKLKPQKYLSIGDKIFEFSTDDDIKEYYSSVGNNDVPYPVAFGEKNIYFMLDGLYIPKNKWPKMTKEMKSDAYSYFYGHSGDEQKYPKKYLKMKNIKIIHNRIW
jgi:hypothetical protein